MPLKPIEAVDGFYFAVSPLLLFPNTRGRFGVYLRIDGRMVLYAHPDEEFTDQHRRKLYSHGVEEIYIQTKQREAFEQYLQANLGNTLLDDELPMAERSKVFYNASLDIVKDTFDNRMPQPLDRSGFDKIRALVEQGTDFLLKDGSIKSLASLISHDYHTYSHSVHVFVFAAALLQTFDLPENQLVAIGIGAILHDIGKTQIPRYILNKKGKLTKEEREIIMTHSLKGVAVCSLLPLSQDSINCILFHHENFDGTGYPAGLHGDDTALPVRVVKICDVYAALTTERPYAPARSPFTALSIMRDEMPGHFDMRLFRRFVTVLSGANVITKVDKNNLV